MQRFLQSFIYLYKFKPFVLVEGLDVCRPMSVIVSYIINIGLADKNSQVYGLLKISK